MSKRNPTLKNINTTFLSNALKLTLGNFSALSINLITLPIITRLYDPESFGVLTILLSLSIIVSEVSCLRFEQVILLAKSDEDSLHALIMCTAFSILALSTITILHLFFKQSILNYSKYYYYLDLYFTYFICLAISFSVYRFLSLFLIKKSEFKTQAFSRICNALINKSTAIIFAVVFSSSPIGLIFGLIFGQCIACLVVLRKIIALSLLRIRKVKYTKYKSLLKKHKRIIYFSSTAIFESYSREIIPLIVGIFFGSSSAGLIGLVQRSIMQPLNTIGDAVSQSYYQIATNYYNEKSRLTSDTFNIFKLLFMLIVPPVTILSLISSDIFHIVFGTKWRGAGSYFIVLSFSYCSNLIYRPFSIIFDIFDKHKHRFLFNITKILSLTIFSIAVATSTRSAIYTVSFFSILNTLLNFGITVFLISHSTKSTKPIIVFIIKYSTITMSIITLLLLTKAFIVTSELSFIFLTIATICTYFSLLNYSGLLLINDIIEILKR